MNLSEKFKSAASSAISKFSIGDYSYVSITETYDEETGVVSRVPEQATFEAAKYAISKEKQDLLSYEEEVCMVAVAGDSFGEIVPTNGNLIVFPDDTQHRIVHVERDQYKAAYFFHVAVTEVDLVVIPSLPEGDPPEEL